MTETKKDPYVVQKEKRAIFGHLIAGLAHELNNPMTFIYSNLDPLRESISELSALIPSKSEASQKLINRIEQTIQHIEEGVKRSQALIENFKNFPAEKKMEKEPVDLNEIIQESFKLLTHKIRQGITIKTNLGMIPKIRGYRTELGQVVTNMITNAIDAISKDGVVTITTDTSPGGIKLSVRDTGEGIPKENFGKIFDPFFTTKPQGAGTGLGLAITLQLVTNHDGSIEVKSEVGQGSEFVVFLPN